jgi:hypothetical protein
VQRRAKTEESALITKNSPRLGGNRGEGNAQLKNKKPPKYGDVEMTEVVEGRALETEEQTAARLRTENESYENYDGSLKELRARAKKLGYRLYRKGTRYYLAKPDEPAGK